jgi:asparagine synthase (glutamine-hydrolysing)
MCGVFGIWSKKKRLQLSNIEKAVNQLRHRGPDDEGYFLFNEVTCSSETAGGTDTPEPVYASSFPYAPKKMLRAFHESDLFHVILGHRRLSVLDLSPAGHQPMSSKNGKLWIVFNGEIYNYLELRSELETKKIQFSTNSDTEVILAAYQEWGEEAVKKFNGMWSFCIFDIEKRTFFCSRDRLGVKPFYYWFDGENFAFASEIKALSCLPFVESVPNDKVIFDHLLIGWLDLGRESFYKGINQLPPGHSLLLDLKGKFSLKPYWKLAPNLEFGKFDEAEFHSCANQYRELLVDAVKIRLRSDVPVGSCLSGGLDSSSLVMIAENLWRKNGSTRNISPLNTFTLTYPDEKSGEGFLDDLEYAKEMIQAIGAVPHFIDPSPEKGSLLLNLKKILDYMDEPFVCMIPLAVYHLFKEIREKGVIVALNGHGADELLGGYLYMLPSYFASMYFENKENNLTQEVMDFSIATGKSIQELLSALELCSYGESFPHPAASEANPFIRFMNQDFFKTYGRERLEKISEDLYPYKNFNALLAASMLKGTLAVQLKYEDRMSMAFSVEERNPFADDYRLIEFATSLPAVYKVRQGWTKYLHREALKDILPDKITWRRKKTPLPVPEKNFMEAAIREYRELIFQSDPYLDHDVLEKEFDSVLDALNHQQGYGFSFARILTLKLWLSKLKGNS